MGQSSQRTDLCQINVVEPFIALSNETVQAYSFGPDGTILLLSQAVCMDKVWSQFPSFVQGLPERTVFMLMYFLCTNTKHFENTNTFNSCTVTDY